MESINERRCIELSDKITNILNKILEVNKITAFVYLIAVAIVLKGVIGSILFGGPSLPNAILTGCALIAACIHHCGLARCGGIR